MKFCSTLLLVSLFLLLQACGSEPARGNPERALEDYVELGLNYLSTGSRGQARQSLLRALEIDPNSTLANNAMALLYQTDGESTLAETHFKKALRMDKDFTQARNNYARFLYMQSRYEEARDQYKLASEDVNYRLRPQAFIGLALSEKALGNMYATEVALQRAISLNPRGAGAVLELTKLKYDQQDYVTAKGYLDRYEAVSPSTSKSLFLGMQLAEQFGDGEALATYAMALKGSFPTSREARELILAEKQVKDE